MATSTRTHPSSQEALYDHYLSLLTLLGTSECGLSHHAATHLAHEVLLASVGNSSRIPNLRAWLTAAMRSAAQLHQEKHGARG